MTHSQYLQDLIRVNIDNKVPPWPTEAQKFTAGSTQPLVVSAALSISKSSCFIFSTISLFHSTTLSFSLSVIPPLSFTLTFQATISLSPTLSINICLWDSLFPHFSRLLLKRTGESSIPCGSEHPLKVRSTTDAGANRSGFWPSHRT